MHPLAKLVTAVALLQLSNLAFAGASWQAVAIAFSDFILIGLVAAFVVGRRLVNQQSSKHSENRIDEIGPTKLVSSEEQNND